MKYTLLPASLLAALLLSACAKDDDPTAQLPPETRSGANTFGCLVNGQPWTPKGYDGTLNYTLYYDRTYRGGNLGLSTYRLNGDIAQYILFGGDSIMSKGTYSLVQSPRTVYFLDNRRAVGCTETTGKSSPHCRGQLTITRLDMQAGIVSGTFWFTLYKPGCDSIRVTNGRFDKKL